MSARDVFEKLAHSAIVRRYFSSARSEIEIIENCRLRGDEPPDSVLPGRFVMSLSDEEREQLSQLFAADVNDRVVK